MNFRETPPSSQEGIEFDLRPYIKTQFEIWRYLHTPFALLTSYIAGLHFLQSAYYSSAIIISKFPTAGIVVKMSLSQKAVALNFMITKQIYTSRPRRGHNLSRSPTVDDIQGGHGMGTPCLGGVISLLREVHESSILHNVCSQF